MKNKVQTKLDAILNYPFFQQCGTDLPNNVTRVRNWEDAVRECTSQKWENCRLMARNVLQHFTEGRAWERSQEWNDIVKELRPLIDSFVTGLLSKTSGPKELLGKLRSDIRWDILFICLEHEYIDVVQPVFYLPYIDRWYAAGHLPCGWDGEEFPEPWDGVIRNGRLMVF